jgi:hypothetical protein
VHWARIAEAHGVVVKVVSPSPGAGGPSLLSPSHAVGPWGKCCCHMLSPTSLL